jgi:hypothetical protein
MDEVPISQTEVKNLRFLRILVTTLTATMILGLLTIVALLVIRFTGETATLSVPDEITLPDGTTATAFTRGVGWYAIVTGNDQILIYDAATNALRQTVKINN